jgi:tRNA pseudouridine55 synthase
MATGLLVVGVDSGTKLLSHLFGLDKQYLAIIRLGQETTTDDAEGAIVSSASASQISREEVQLQIEKLTGEIEQVPSSVSAIKVEGRRAYEIVRSGESVELVSRRVKIYRLHLTSEVRQIEEFVEFDVLVDCSSGTYIRALARDMGRALGVGGHLRELRRTMVGEFRIDDASKPDELRKPMTLLEVATLLFPVIELTDAQARDIFHGKRITLEESSNVAASYRGALLAILEPIAEAFRSVTVFPEAFDG